jgi:hydrogenase/urease accessory protein HupE
MERYEKCMLRLVSVPRRVQCFSTGVLLVGLVVAMALLDAPRALAHAGVQLKPPDDLSTFGALLEFSKYGAKHILLGYDHLLFLLGLSVLARGLRDVLEIAALFALSYSTTLIGGTLLDIDVPDGAVEPVIALSVGYVGVQIAFGREGGRPSRDPRPAALLFGTAHGLGLSGLLQDLRLPGDDLLPSVIGFNIGVELGQLAVLVAFIGLLAGIRAFPFPARERIPAGFALLSASAVLLAFATLDISPAHAHPAKPPPPPATPPRAVDEIPGDDASLYHSRVTAIRPKVPGLSAKVLGGDERLEVTWTGQPPLVVLGTEGEPMFRLSSAGVEFNELSPSVYLTADRYAQVPQPANVDPRAQPRWRRVERPGRFSWYDHRIHWLDDERPEIVGDGSEPATIFHWKVPAVLGDQPIKLVGALDWAPDPGAIRANRSSTSGELVTAAILLVAMALGAGVGVLYRRRVEGHLAGHGYAP